MTAAISAEFVTQIIVLKHASDGRSQGLDGMQPLKDNAWTSSNN